MSIILANLVKKLLGVIGKATPADPASAPVSELELCLRRAAESQVNGRYESALVESNRALQLDATNALAYHIRSLARYGLADEEGALADWEQAQFLRTKDAWFLR